MRAEQRQARLRNPSPPRFVSVADLSHLDDPEGEVVLEEDVPSVHPPIVFPSEPSDSD